MTGAGGRAWQALADRRASNAAAGSSCWTAGACVRERVTQGNLRAQRAPSGLATSRRSQAVLVCATGRLLDRSGEGAGRLCRRKAQSRPRARPSPQAVHVQGSLQPLDLFAFLQPLASRFSVRGGAIQCTVGFVARRCASLCGPPARRAGARGRRASAQQPCSARCSRLTTRCAGAWQIMVEQACGGTREQGKVIWLLHASEAGDGLQRAGCLTVQRPSAKLACFGTAPLGDGAVVLSPAAVIKACFIHTRGRTGAESWRVGKPSDTDGLRSRIVTAWCTQPSSDELSGGRSFTRRCGRRRSRTHTCGGAWSRCWATCPRSSA